MLDITGSCHANESFYTNYVSSNSLYSCNLKDRVIFTEISDAVSSLSYENAPFAFFDLMLSDYDKDLLSQIKIKEFGAVVVSGELVKLPSKITEFFNSVLEQQNQDALTSLLAKLMGNIISKIIAVSNTNAAVVSMLAYNEGLGEYYPSWHIDKTQAEEIMAPCSEIQLHETQNVFIVTLKGASTRYHHLDLDTRVQFNRLANESSHAYGYDSAQNYVPGQGIDKLFSLQNSYAANIGFGSVHLAGHLHGTVHTTPEGDERLLFIVTPSDEWIIQ